MTFVERVTDSEERWNAIGRFYKPKKITVTILLGADVVAWINAPGEGYQTRINAPAFCFPAVRFPETDLEAIAFETRLEN